MGTLYIFAKIFPRWVGDAVRVCLSRGPGELSPVGRVSNGMHGGCRGGDGVV